MGFQDLLQAEARVLSLGAEPARRSLSALWRQDRTAGEADAVYVLGAFNHRHCEGRSDEAIQSRMLGSGLLREACHRAALGAAPLARNDGAKQQTFFWEEHG